MGDSGIRRQLLPHYNAIGLLGYLAKRLSKQGAAAVRIATPPAFRPEKNGSQMVQAVRGFRARFGPRDGLRMKSPVSVNLFDMSCGDQFHALEDGKIDLGFVGLHEPIERRGLHFQTIASYKTVVAL